MYVFVCGRVCVCVWCTDLTQGLAQHPTVHQSVYDSDRETHNAHEDVRARQVGDQDVGDVAQLLLPGDNEHEACVAQQPDCYNGTVRYDPKSGPAHGGWAMRGVCPIGGLPDTEEAAVVGHGRERRGEGGDDVRGDGVSGVRTKALGLLLNFFLKQPDQSTGDRKGGRQGKETQLYSVQYCVVKGVVKCR